jgi:hypothetical protein
MMGAGMIVGVYQEIVGGKGNRRWKIQRNEEIKQGSPSLFPGEDSMGRRVHH